MLNVYLYYPCAKNDKNVFENNITNNLAVMAEVVTPKLYNALWRPGVFAKGDEQILAKDLIEPLTLGLDILTKDEISIRQFNARQGWKGYDELVAFTKSYLEACKKYFNAHVFASA